MPNRFRSRLAIRLAVVLGLMFTAVEAVHVTAASANAANPTSTINESTSNNGLTVTLSGSWTWPGQSCEGRFGEGWAVDWWGISTSKTAASFGLNSTLTSASEVLFPPGTSTTTQLGVNPAGAIPINMPPPPPGSPPQPQMFFHVGTFYNGEVINGAALAGSARPSASATRMRQRARSASTDPMEARSASPSAEASNLAVLGILQTYPDLISMTVEVMSRQPGRHYRSLY